MNDLTAWVKGEALPMLLDKAQGQLFIEGSN